MTSSRIVRLAFLGLFSCVAAGAALAQRPTLTEDVDAGIRAPYQEATTSFCSGSPCIVKFSTVGVGKRRVIDFINCSIDLPAGSVLGGIALLPTSFAPPRVFLTLSQGPSGATSYVANAHTQLVFNAGDAPQAYAYTASGAGSIADLECTVMGREVAVP